MNARRKQSPSGGGGQPHAAASWLAGMVIGITIGNLAAGAMMLGTTTAIGKAMIVTPPVMRRT